MISTLEQKSALQKSSNRYFLIGLGIIALCFCLLVGSTALGPDVKDTMGLMALCAMFIGSAFILFACMDYLASKGYSKVLALLALFGLIGWLIIILLPDKNKS